MTFTASAGDELRRAASANRSEPAFMRITPKHFRTLIQRMSPHCKEGAWPTGEFALLAEVITLWLVDIAGAAQKQFKNEGAMWLSRKMLELLVSDRVGINVIAQWLDIKSYAINRVLSDLQLGFDLPVSGSEDVPAVVSMRGFRRAAGRR